MLANLLRFSVAVGLAAAVSLPALPVRADSGDAFGAQVVSGANLALKNVLKSEKKSLPQGTLAQVPPVTQPPVGGAAQQGLPTGFTYTADLSIAYPYGNIGRTGKKWLPGGFDASAGYGFDRTTRLQANYYEIQHYPVGFNSGVVPACVQGLPNCSSADLSQIQPQIDVTTKDKFLLLMVEKLVKLGNFHGHDIPIVITPTYVSRTSKIAASNNGTDIVPFEYNGFPVFNLHTRTAQLDSLAFTLPILSTPKMFGTFTVAPTWLTHTNGLNQTNHAQLYQILYLEYNPTKTTKIFFEPQSSRDYLPTDPYPQHLYAYFAGVSHLISKNAFVQVVLNSGGPNNYQPYGVTSLNCQQAGNCANTTVPGVGGLKATQVQIQFGIGSPNVIQF
ncbi:MAG: hypothetical protein M3Y21_02200 [Candidatus Eremiobacteraeota bacterium]|nr:hypothetical protein [Candidatus Eremiobacteraeota bacterium]